MGQTDTVTILNSNSVFLNLYELYVFNVSFLVKGEIWCKMDQGYVEYDNELECVRRFYQNAINLDSAAGGVQVGTPPEQWTIGEMIWT